jgi:hypothetical protein
LAADPAAPTDPADPAAPTDPAARATTATRDRLGRPIARLGKGAYSAVRLHADCEGRPVAVKSYGHADVEQNACVKQHLMVRVLVERSSQLAD